MWVLKRARGVKKMSLAAFLQSACLCNVSVGNNDSLSTEIRPQLSNRHSIKTLWGNTDRKQTELTGEHAALHKTNT